MPAVTAKFDLTLGFRAAAVARAVPRPGSRPRFEYATDLFDEATVEALAGRLTRLLRPGRRVTRAAG